MNTKLRRLTGALTLAIAMMLAVLAAPAFAQGPVDLSVTKNVDNPTPASGDTVVYTIDVTNNSLITDATGVVLTDNLPAGVTWVSDDSVGAYNTTTGEWTIGSLVTNTTVALNITATVDPAANGTVVTNTATVAGAETDPNAANDSASADITVTNPPPAPEADLTISKSVDNATPASGGQIVYTVVITNNGPNAASGVVVTDTLPAGVAHVSDSSGGAYNTTTGEWTVGVLNANTSQVLNITADVTAANGDPPVTNTADVAGAETDPNPGDNTASVDINVTAAPIPPVVVTVSDTNLVPQSGLTVYVFSGTTYINVNGVTNASGQVTFTLGTGNYNFRADLNGTRFFSGGASGTNTCSVPGCAADSVTVTTPVVVTVHDTNGVVQEGLPVFAFNGTTYSGKTGNTDVNGQVSLTLLPGNYNFRADLNGTRFYSGGASGVNTCDVANPNQVCVTDQVTVTTPISVTVVDTNGVPQQGLPVYAFNGPTYTGKTGTTDANGQVSFTLVPGDYNFRADVNADRFYSGGASGVNTCTIAASGVNCTGDSVTVSLFADVTITVVDTYGVPQQGLSLFAFTGITYTGRTSTTNAAGQVTLSLPADSYNFRADLNGTRFFSGGASGTDTCTTPACTTDGITVTTPVSVTVRNTSGVPQSGLPVYAFSGTTYTGKNGTTNANGEIALTLVPGSYNFRSDLNGTQFFSGGAAGVATCDIANTNQVCVTDQVTVTTPISVTVIDTNGFTQSGVSVYAFTGITYTGKTATTDVNGQVALTLLPGSYNFRADYNGGQYFSGGASGVDTCNVLANGLDCVSDTVTVQAILVPKPVTVTVTSAGGAVVPNQLVQVHTVATNGISTTATTISDTTDISGTVTFSLLDNSYKFFAGDTFGSYSSDVCNVPTCTTASLFMFTPVEITVVDTTGADVAGQDVYVFDNLNVYQNISGTTNISGSVSLDLNSNNYLFWAYDANGAAYGSVPAPCTTPDCATAVITMPVFGMVDVTVTDGINIVPNQLVQVYTVDTNGITTPTTISDTSNISGTVGFTLAEGAYQFGGVVSGTTYLSATCNVPTCTTSSLILAAVSPVTVTVQDSVGNPLENQVVTVFDDVAGLATPVTGTTNISGTVDFNLPDGDYRFTADGVDGITYFSTSGVDPVCTVPGCTDALLTLPAAAVTLPAATCTETSSGNRTCDLWATTGTLNLPDGTSLPFWGYSDTATGPAQLPGPMLIVNQGENVTVNLTNTLPEDSALLFKGLNMVPDLNGAAANGGTATYTLDTSQPGTFQYQAGLILNGNGNRQTALGMAGALVIRPVNAGTPVLDQAYDAKSQFDDETLVVLGEVDPRLNNSPTTFNMRDFKPKYWLINGTAYPETTTIQTVAGHNVLLRYVNTGLNYHSMGVLGQVQTLHATDGEPRPGARNVQAETVSPGETMDVIVSVPATVTPDTRFAVYDTSLLLHNSNADGFGGMMTFLATLPDNTLGNPGGPITLDVTLTPDSTVGGVDVAMIGQVSDVTTGGDDIQVAEYFIGAPGTPGTGTALVASDGTYDSPTEDVEAPPPGIPAAALASLGSGNFTIYVHAQDVLGNWGAFHPVVLHLDKDGPASTGLELSPNPGGGSGTVLLTGTGDDRLTGNSNVVAAQYTVDGNTFPMAVNVTAPIVGLTADVDVSAMTEGIHTVSVESKDEFNHWGNPGTIDLMVDKTGPDTVSVALLPSANNGFLPVNPSLFSMRVNATVSDTVSGGVLSTIHAVEGFIDYQGVPTDTNGSGFPLTPADGQYNSTGEDAYAFIPLSTVNRLTEGLHKIGIHGQDASGNWGAVVEADLIIDKTPPTVSGLIANPNPTNSAPTTALAATATDAATAINRAEWFEGADPGQGNGMPMFITANGPAWDITGSIDLTGWADGNYVIWARARDAAGNWSQAISTTLTVAEAPTPAADQLYFSTLGGGNNNPVQNVNPPFDDADIYHWDGLIGGNAFDRLFDGTAAGLVGHADIDGVKVDLANGLYYMSFNRDAGTAVPTLGGVGDEDIVVVDTLNNNEWNLEFAGIECGLNGTNGRDIDAFDIVGNVIYFSTVGNDRVNTAGTDTGTNALGGPYDDADIYMWNGVECSRFWDARSGAGNFLPGNADIDGLTIVDHNTFYMSFNRGTTTIPGFGSVRDEDVVLFDNGTWSLFFDGSARDLNNGGQDLDAVDVKW